MTAPVPLFLFLLLLLPSKAAAAEFGELREVPKDLWGGAKEEVRPEGLLTLLTAGAAASIARYGGTTAFDDYRVADALQRHPVMGKRATDFGAAIGDPLYLLPALALTYVAGKYSHQEPTQEFGVLGFEALALAGIETEILKVSVRRLRPDHTDLAAFPSGHASESFALATVAASQYGWKAGVPAYVLASFVGYTRMESNKHYLSDVLFGAGLGIACGRAVFKVRRRGHPDRYAFTPFVSPGGGGVAVFF